MNGSVAPAIPQLATRPGRGTAALLWLATIVALVFIAVAALPYLLRVDEQQFRQYWPMRGWLLVHVGMGMVALLSGPVQLWLGFRDLYPRVHKNLGFVYIAAVIVGSVAAYYLAFHTSGGMVFGAGLAGLATAWLATTGLAFLAITRHLYDQHKEWMIRSYVVTFAFVTFRALQALLQSRGVSLLDSIGIAAWFCWAAPLLANELIMQGRKILAVRAG
jgi:hypothetical protein